MTGREKTIQEIRAEMGAYANKVVKNAPKRRFSFPTVYVTYSKKKKKHKLRVESLYPRILIFD